MQQAFKIESKYLQYILYYNVLQTITIYLQMNYRPTVMLVLNGGSGLDSMPDDKILVLRPGYQGHSFETW